ncbi:MAG: Hydrogenase maturation protease [Myxococcales bacterium]|nr:Hydrogenase maturation protease [Myxococcales bacterium]
MTRILVAGVGNLFFGDDGFGGEVARRLGAKPPPDATVTDFGIRAIHLAYELLSPFELCIFVDCMPRGGAPGTLYVLEPDLDGAIGTVADAHGMNLPIVFAAVRELGGTMPRAVVVGCEPTTVEPGIGLSPSVARAIPMAVELIRDLITSQQEVTP